MSLSPRVLQFTRRRSWTWAYFRCAARRRWPRFGLNLSSARRRWALGCGEYVTVTDSVQVGEVTYKSQGAEPSAWNTEIGYSFDGIANGATIAVAYQETNEAVALGLPESRLSLALSIDLVENTTLSLEWVHDKAYSTADGGTG